MCTHPLPYLKLSFWISPSLLCTIPFFFFFLPSWPYLLVIICRHHLYLFISHSVFHSSYPGFLQSLRIAEMAPVEVTIDLHDDAKSNGHLSLFILFNFSSEFNTADCIETFSLVSSVTLLHNHVCLFISYLSGHSASVSFAASPSQSNLMLGLLLCTKHTLSQG